MRGSAAFRTGVAPGGALAGPWVRNPLWTAARAVPSLDLRFADNKSLVDAATGQNLVTFTRASSGTYVDSQGVIRTATTNLLLRSEEFNDSVWGKVGGSVTADAITAPNGQTTADLFTENTVLTQHDVRVTSPTLTDGVTYTLTVYSKANGRRLNIIYPLDTAGHGATFDLVNGTFTYTGNTVTATIQPVGDGWYRCSCTATKFGGSGTVQLRFLTHNGTTNNYTGDGTSGIYLWGAQLEQSNTVGEYIPTTSTINSAPRFDHSPTTGESLGLLVEEQRTNLLLQSEDFATTWTASNLTVTTNSVVAPDGTTTADTIAPPADGLTASRLLRQNPALTTQQAYTLSVFAKIGTATINGIALYVSDSTATNNFRSNFNLFALTTSAAGTGWATPAATIVPYPNGWYRCILSGVTSTAHTGLRAVIYLNAAGTVADTYGSIHLWGAQLEAGAFPTSYIPTTTATVTRSADVASITGSNFSSWYRQDEGALFLDAASSQSTTAANAGAVINDGTLTNRIELDVKAGSLGGAGRVTIVSGGSTSFDTGNSSLPLFSVGTFYRQAVSYRLDNFAYALNGGSTQVDTSGSVPVAPNQIEIGARLVTALPLNGTIRRLTYWPQRLPNSTLQQITQ